MFGFRSGELLELRVHQVDLSRRTVRLDPGATKYNDGRIIKMTREVFDLLSACISGIAKMIHVFIRHGGHIKDFRGAWSALCEDCGLGDFVKGEDGRLKWRGLLFHDLRRSAVRNMARAGTPEVLSMKISGHKSRSVFDKYNIVSEPDLVEAASKLEKRTDTTTDTTRTA